MYQNFERSQATLKKMRDELPKRESLTIEM